MRRRKKVENTTKAFGDHKLPYKEILGADGKTMVRVYDGDVDYRPTKDFINYSYYIDENGKRWKTRAYNQWTSLTSRCLKGGAYQGNQPTYVGCTLSEEFQDYDKFVAWAEDKEGFMWVNGKGQLWQLDKDLRGDSKKYSRDTVCFLPIRLNSMLNVVATKGDFGYADVLNEVIENYFEIISEDVIEGLINKIGFNCGLNKQERITVEEYNNKQQKMKGCADFYSRVLWIETTTKNFDDLYGNISFIDGKYHFKLQSTVYGFVRESSESIKNILLTKCDKFLERLEEIREKNCESEFWEEKFYEEKYLELKGKINERKYLLEQSKIPLKQYVIKEVF